MSQEFYESIEPPHNGKVTEKLWGMEVVTAHCPDPGYTGKILHLNPGFVSSIHRHETKHETFFLMDGAVVITFYDISVDQTTINEEVTCVLQPGAWITVPSGRWHSFHGLVPSRILETSTLHSEEDVERYAVSRRID